MKEKLSEFEIRRMHNTSLITHTFIRQKHIQYLKNQMGKASIDPLVHSIPCEDK
jgi:hypothetical protein